jgi:hypothetical protein
VSFGKFISKIYQLNISPDSGFDNSETDSKKRLFSDQMLKIECFSKNIHPREAVIFSELLSIKWI